MTPRTLLMMLCTALPLCAQTPTAAETAYRDAWWAESGRNDLENALRGYLEASAADGPAAIRAKALFAAACLQQRLGRNDDAIGTFRRVMQQNPQDTDLVERSRSHLRELTAVDLRTGYDEWYQRRLFSEEVQLQILQKIQELVQLGVRPTPPPGPVGPGNGGPGGAHVNWEASRRRLIGEIMAYGPGAVPALRKAAESVGHTLSDTAVDMLFELGEVPPAAALARTWDDWGMHWERWAMLLALAGEPKAQQLQNGLPAQFRGRAFVLGALQGGKPLHEALMQCDDAHLLRNQQHVVGAIARALMRCNDQDLRGWILAAMVDPKRPAVLRAALEHAVLNTDEQSMLTAAEWLAAGREPENFELRRQALEQATATLRANDGASLDEVFARIDAWPYEQQEEIMSAFGSGIEQNPRVDELPWDEVRLRKVLLMRFAQGSFAERVFVPMSKRAGSRELCCAAMFGDPVQVAKRFHEADVTLGMFLGWESGAPEAETAMRAAQWSRTLIAGIGQRWPQYDDEQRLAALRLLVQGIVHPQYGELRKIAEFMLGLKNGASEAVSQAIDATLLGLGC